eukprot:gene1385-15793_t
MVFCGLHAPALEALNAPPVKSQVKECRYPPSGHALMNEFVNLPKQKIMSKKDCRFIVALGDNFYNSGVKDVHDKRFSQTFEKVYTKKFHYVPWYFVAGNHDHYSNVSAQIAYSKVSPRWQFPHFFHSKVHKIPGTDKSVHAIFIDTTLLSHICEKNRRDNEPLVHGQLQWITNELKKSKSDYLIVAGHHPILSAGAHGNSPCLMTKLKPLLEKYDVTAYFSGHDHNLQHISDPKSNVAYFVSGSGNFYNGWHSNARKLPKGSLRFFQGLSGGFALMDLSDKDGELTFIDSDGKHLYNTKIKRRDRQTDKREAHNEKTDLLKNFFLHNKQTDVVSEFWKWFKPIRLRR